MTQEWIMLRLSCCCGRAAYIVQKSQKQYALNIYPKKVVNASETRSPILCKIDLCF